MNPVLVKLGDPRKTMVQLQAGLSQKVARGMLAPKQADRFRVRAAAQIPRTGLVIQRCKHQAPWAMG